MNGASPGRLYQLDKEITIIGRNPDCDIVLAPKSVSRKHAAIVRKLAGYRAQGPGQHARDLRRRPEADSAGLPQGWQHDPDRRGVASFSSRLVQIEEGDDEQSTVFAAIDVLNQSDKHFPMVKPEAKFRALAADRPGAGRHARPDRGARTDLQLAVRDLPQGRARVCACSKTRRPARLLPQIIRSRTGPAGELKISKTVLNRVMNGRPGHPQQGPRRGIPRQRQRLRQQDSLAHVRAALR